MEISNGILTATINPLGAEVYSLKDSTREYIWEGDANHWAKRSPVLFPIVGCLKKNSYVYNGKTYSLTRHGFARDNIFTIELHAGNKITFLLKANKDTKVMYPFDFELEIDYLLHDRTLDINYTVRNKGNNDMPFSIGGHPAFALTKPIGNYSLKFNSEEVLLTTKLQENLLSDEIVPIPLANNLLPLNYELFKNDALVLKKPVSRSVELIENNTPLLKVNFEKMPHLGIWTKDKAPFVCIEPWQGYADKLESNGNIFEKEGIITLQPDEKYQTGYSIQILS